MKILLEHKREPGLVYQNRLMLGDVEAVFSEMDLHEAKDEEGRNIIKFRGKFQEAEAINKNKRTYPFSVLNTNVSRLQETIDKGGLIGELDHPTDSIVHFKEASHRVVKLWWEGNNLMGEGHVLSTPCGNILKSLITDGVRVGISSRGVGNGKVNEEGILVIGESYKLITFDAVADPSTFAAFQEKVKPKKEGVNHRSDSKNDKNSLKNEGGGIDTVNKDLLLACIGGIVKKQTGEIKARLS